MALKTSSVNGGHPGWLGPAVIVVGLLLMGSSFFPLEWTKRQHWTPDDARNYERLSLQYHESAYESAARAGRSEAEMQAYREELKTKFESMRDRLLAAQQQPQRWGKFLLWSGCVLAGIGYLLAMRRGT